MQRMHQPCGQHNVLGTLPRMLGIQKKSSGPLGSGLLGILKKAPNVKHDAAHANMMLRRPKEWIA
jgi:hypothetical protein